MFSTTVSPSKWVTEPAFEVGTSARVADREDVRRGLRLQRVAIGRHEPESIAEALASARRTPGRRGRGS